MMFSYGGVRAILVSHTEEVGQQSIKRSTFPMGLYVFATKIWNT